MSRGTGEGPARDDSPIRPGEDRPGNRPLRKAVASTWNYLPGRRTFGRDSVAGLNTAIANVPDGMANAVIVGVNPIYGLYATTLGPLVGGALSSTRLMGHHDDRSGIADGGTRADPCPRRRPLQPPGP